MNRIKNMIIISIFAIGFIFGVIGCGEQTKKSNNTEISKENSVDNPKEAVKEAIGFDNVKEVALNYEENLLSDTEKLNRLYEILDEMDLQEYNEDNVEDKEGFLRLIFYYQDGSKKNVTLSAKKIFSVGSLKYQLENNDEISQAISELFDDMNEE